MAKDLEARQKDELRAAHERGGPAEVIRQMRAVDDPESRRALYQVAQRTFGPRDWPGKSLDAMITIVSACIEETLEQARAAKSPEAARDITDFANRMSYNLSADLAECWPEDTTPREPRHFEAGLRAAEECVRWRRELGKAPDRRAMGYWAVGMHQLSLGNLHESLGAFDTATGLAREAVAGTGKEEIKPGGDFGVILYAGYAGIVRWKLGDPRGRAEYERACEAFQGPASRSEEEKEDAEFGFAQLRYVAEKFSPAGAAA
jgi:hypothetical protein